MNKEIIKKFKRASAGALAVAVIALGTSCTYVPPEESTLNTTNSSITETTEPIATQPIVTDKVTIEDIEDIKPVYNQNVVEPEMIEANNKLNVTIKEMINEDKYYGDNFTYLVERLTITNIAIEAYNAEEEVTTDYAPSNKAKVTITYNADVVDKQTAEKSTVTNTISYVVEDDKVASLANQEKVSYTELTEAVNTATEEKLEEIEATGEQATEQDEVTSRQSVITGKFAQKAVTPSILNDFYNTEVLKSYLDNGYKLISMLDYGDSVNCSVGLWSDGKEQYKFTTPDGALWGNNDGERITATLYFYFTTLASNEETNDKRLIVFLKGYVIDIPKEKLDELKSNMLQYAYFDPYKELEEEMEKSEWGIGVWTGKVCGSEPFNDKFYSILEDLVNNYELKFLQYQTIQDISVEDINNYDDAKRVMTLMDENNTNVYIKEASNELENN